MKRSPVPAIVLVLALAGSAGLKTANEALPRTKVPGSGIIYLPSGQYLKPMTFGFSSLAADMIFLWAIQFYGNPAIPDKFKPFDHIFSILSELDPRWVDPYEVGALIALNDARDVALAIRILDLGLAKNPDRWIFPMQAGHYAQYYAKDFDLARAYYKKVMDIPGSPPIAKRLYANAAFKTLDFKTAWETWTEVHDTSEDEAVRKIASNHLYNIKAVVDVEAVRNAVFDFRTRAGRNPASLDELVRAGHLREVPRDLDGRDYLYDPKTGQMTTRVNPWKR
jgi:tetratricopeptide (TPR) repeat protein